MESNNYTPEIGAMVRFIGHHMPYGLNCGDKGLYRGIAPSLDTKMRGDLTAVKWAMSYGERPHMLQVRGEMFFVKREHMEPVDDYIMCEPGGGWENCEWQPPKEHQE